MQEVFPEEFYRYLENNTLTGIKAGRERNSFLNIWMVNVDGRIFARSWGRSERSWFTTLLNGAPGQIRFGETVLDIIGRPCTDAALNARIDQAYRQRYQTPENLPYAIGITRPEYADYTMEFLYSKEGC